MLLRTIKRRTSWEVQDEAEFCRIEFRTKDGPLDRELSVYQIEFQRSTMVQTAAEHTASAGLAPAHVPCADLAGIDGPDLHQTPGDSQFTFTREAHHELHFRDDDSLRDFAKGLLAASAERRALIDKKEISEYVGRRLASGDGDWVAFCEGNAKWGASKVQGPTSR